MRLPDPVSDLLPEGDTALIKNALTNLDRVARESVGSAVGEKEKGSCTVSFSGGIDSSILAVLANSLHEMGLFSLGETASHDMRFLNDMNFPDHNLIAPLIESVTKSDIEIAAKKVVKLINASTLSQLEDCTAFHLIGEKLRGHSKNARYIITANGPDELFCGYDRFRRLVDSEGYSVLDKEIARSLQVARELKEAVKNVLSEFNLASLDPFLSDEFVAFCQQGVPVQLKIRMGDDRLRKRLWRLYGRTLGLPESIVTKPKKAMQYSMGIHKILFSMIKRGELTLNSEHKQERAGSAWRNSDTAL